MDGTFPDSHTVVVVSVDGVVEECGPPVVVTVGGLALVVGKDRGFGGCVLAPILFSGDVYGVAWVLCVGVEPPVAGDALMFISEASVGVQEAFYRGVDATF
ncbi:hypothetical protein G7Y31_05315 [Corynebacterium lizhenjunii]|uniref:Uncharacterized protein n=1 Tax=Corynebacterium lizhenjunii TaxID=2709394 RepID=A0A7T0KG60_9CORY|nr:hypothetical protein G7Y31_05315 [Corynebacterium lizhenjunii]